MAPSPNQVSGWKCMQTAQSSDCVRVEKYTSAQEQVGDRVQLWVWTRVTQTVITVNVVVGVGCTISYSVFEAAPPSTPQTVLALLYS